MNNPELNEAFEGIPLVDLTGPDGTVFHRNTLSYTENTQTALDLEGYKTVITYRPDGQMEKMETYAPSGELERLTEYIYSQIQVPAKEE